MVRVKVKVKVRVRVTWPDSQIEFLSCPEVAVAFRVRVDVRVLGLLLGR